MKTQRGIPEFVQRLTWVNAGNLNSPEGEVLEYGVVMFDEQTRAVLRAILDEVCEDVGKYQNAARAYVASKILVAAAGRDLTVDELRDAGRAALKSVPRFSGDPE